MGCTTPVVVFNELSGPGLVTPWSDSNAQYRANVLALLQDIAALGAHPVLLIPAAAYTGGDALTWWQQVSAVAEIVREIYKPATATWKLGPILGNRDLRNSYRAAVTNLTSIGIPANRVGLMVSFATTVGFGVSMANTRKLLTVGRKLLKMLLPPLTNLPLQPGHRRDRFPDADDAVLRIDCFFLVTYMSLRMAAATAGVAM
jgi:hypothetical protein